MKRFIGVNGMNELTKIIRNELDKVDINHTHDNLYYTKDEIDNKLNNKSNTNHNHDDRYYTESEMNTKLAAKSDTSHTHSYIPLSDITRSNGVTTTGQKVLDAVEKNPSISGTLANKVQTLGNVSYKNGVSVYISDSGNDSNDGLSSSKPIKTLNKFRTLHYETVTLRIVTKLTITGTQCLSNVIRINSATSDTVATLNMSAQANIFTNGKIVFEQINITGSLLTIQAASVLFLKFQFTSSVTLYECDCKIVEGSGNGTLTLVNSFAILTGAAGFSYPITVSCVNAIIAVDRNVSIPKISGERASITMVTS